MGKETEKIPPLVEEMGKRKKRGKGNLADLSRSLWEEMDCPKHLTGDGNSYLHALAIHVHNKNKQQTYKWIKTERLGSKATSGNLEMLSFIKYHGFGE